MIHSVAGEPEPVRGGKGKCAYYLLAAGNAAMLTTLTAWTGIGKSTLGLKEIDRAAGLAGPV
jgi:hypothetical protein